MSEQLNSCQKTQHSGWQKENRKTTKPDVQLNSTRLTQAIVFHKLCRDHHAISAVQEILEKEITELLSPKMWRYLEKLGLPVRRIPNYQRRPPPNRRCISTLQPRGESPPPSMSSNPLAVEGVFLSNARSFASNRPSLFPGLPRWALQAWLELEPRLQRTKQSRNQVTRHLSSNAYTASRGHCPSSRRVRLTSHIERQLKFDHGTADLQSVSCTLRDRDVLTLCSWQRHNLLRWRIRLQQMITKVNPSTRRGVQSLQFICQDRICQHPNLTWLFLIWKTPAEYRCFAAILAQTFEHTLRGTRRTRHESRCFFRCILRFWSVLSNIQCCANQWSALLCFLFMQTVGTITQTLTNRFRSRCYSDFPLRLLELLLTVETKPVSHCQCVFRIVRPGSIPPS